MSRPREHTHAHKHTLTPNYSGATDDPPSRCAHTALRKTNRGAAGTGTYSDHAKTVREMNRKSSRSSSSFLHSGAGALCPRVAWRVPLGSQQSSGGSGGLTEAREGTIGTGRNTHAVTLFLLYMCESWGLPCSAQRLVFPTGSCRRPTATSLAVCVSVYLCCVCVSVYL